MTYSSWYVIKPNQINVYIYTLDKNIRPRSKMKKKVLFTIFKLWKLDISKIRHKDNKIQNMFLMHISIYA